MLNTSKIGNAFANITLTACMLTTATGLYLCDKKVYCHEISSAALLFLIAFCVSMLLREIGFSRRFNELKKF